METIQENAMQIVMDLTEIIPVCMNQLPQESFDKIFTARKRAIAIAGGEPEQHIIAGYRREVERAVADIAVQFSGVQNVVGLLDDELCTLAFTAENFTRLVNTYLTKKQQQSERCMGEQHE